MQSHPVTVNTSPLLSFDEMQDHLRFAEVEDQADAVRKMMAAVRFCERYTHRNFLTTTRRMRFRQFPACSGEIQLDYPPWQSISSITYLDTAGVSQTLSTDDYDFDEDRGAVFLKYGKLWPSTYSQKNAITITFLCGWTSKELVPEDIKQAVAFVFGHNYANREAVINGSISQDVKLTVDSYLAPWIDPRY